MNAGTVLLAAVGSLLADQLQEFQVTGGPAWIGRDCFDVVAKADGGSSRAPLMLRALLVERFGLATHIDAKEMSIYALVLAKSDGSLGPQPKE